MFHCHCHKTRGRDCQRATGAPYSSVIGMPGAAFKLLQGTPRWYSTPSTAGGLLRLFKPEMHLWTCDAQPWDHMNPDLPKFRHYPPQT